MADPTGKRRTEIAIEAGIIRLWLRAHSQAAIAAAMGVSKPTVRRVLGHKARELQAAGADWKAMRAAGALALNDWAKAKLIDRIDDAGEKFSIRDMETLIKWVDFEARLVGYLAPVKAEVRNVTDSMTTEEMIAEARQLGVEVPKSLLERVGLPPARANDG